MAALRIETRKDAGAAALIDELAALRITVFRDFPYLYDGTLDYEQWYIGKLLAARDHVIVCAFDGDTLVGASTGAPMAGEHEEFAAPFKQLGHDIDAIFYFGESVLLPAYRGRGIGHAFFDGREAHAAALGFAKTAFCAVIRPPDHPARPDDYVPLDDFWKKRGYVRLEGVTTSFSWRDLGDTQASEKPMQFWGKGF